MSAGQLSRKTLIVAAPANERHLASVGWAVAHGPTREAYRRCTGEDAGPILDRYQAWLAENIIGAGEAVDC